MEDKTGLKQENTKESRGGNGYCLFDERTLNSYLYGGREVRVIDVKKLKRKGEGEQGVSSLKKRKTAADHEKPRLTNAIRSFPDEVHLCISSIPGAGYGVCAKEHIPLGTWIGPYEGSRLPPQHLSSDIDTAYLWEIYKDGRLSHYIDGSDEENSSWMRFILCARHVKEQNLYAFQYCGNIFYRAFKEVPPGTELLVWYDDKYPQFFGIPLGIQDYEFFRDSVTSSNSRGSPVCSATSTFVDPMVRYTNDCGFQESRDNPDIGNFRVPSPRGPQPHFSCPTSSVGNIFHRNNLTTGIRGGPSFAAGSVESKRCEAPLIATTRIDRQFSRNFSQIPVSNGDSCYSLQSRNKDSQEKILKTVNSTRGHTSDKHLERQRDEGHVTRNERGLPMKINAPREMPPLQFFDNGHQNSSRTSEGQALKRTGEAVKSVMPALRPYMPPLLHKPHYCEPQRIQTSAISPDEFGMWRCRQCLKTFTQRVLLQMHECSQTPDKPYQCGQCTLSFATPSDLRSHVDTHTNEKLFKCGFCSRSFSGATTLNNHIRTHTGEKPFICEKCHRTFSQASHLARHQRTPGECVS